jgi:hypothetical protein
MRHLSRSGVFLLLGSALLASAPLSDDRNSPWSMIRWGNAA